MATPITPKNKYHSPYPANKLGIFDAICWYCDRGKDMCSWERELKPVAGWKAVKSITVDGAYHVLDCPLFVRGKQTREISVTETLAMKGDDE